MIAMLKAAGIPVEVPEQTRLLHHKFAVLDGRRVVISTAARRQMTAVSLFPLL